jgi:hypothetical protein
MLLKKGRIMTYGTRDQALDLWIETKLLHRDRSKRYSVGAYTKYANKALLLINDLEMPYRITRRHGDMKYEVEIYGHVELADSWEDMAYTICRLIFQVIERQAWPHYVEEANGKNS